MRDGVEVRLVRAWERRQAGRRRAVVATVAIANRRLDPHPEWVRPQLADDLGEACGGGEAAD